MKILVTGRGTSGSWQIRGQQLGCAVGAFVEPNAGQSAIDAADVIVVVKRWDKHLAIRLLQSGKPVIWDVVDAWPQPLGNSWTIPQASSWIREQAKLIGAKQLIFPTAKMKQDVGMQGEVVYHHVRPGIRANPIREHISVVAYEGSEKYLGIWRRRIEVECEKRGWRFLVNPFHLADADIVVAFRDEKWAGEVPERWKSNVKLANCQGSGTPCILQKEYGYYETQSGAEKWAVCLTDLQTAFCHLASQNVRREISSKLKASAPQLPEVASIYKKFLERVYANG